MIEQGFRKTAQGKWVCPLYSGLFTDIGCALLKRSHVESRLAMYNDTCTYMDRSGFRALKTALNREVGRSRVHRETESPYPGSNFLYRSVVKKNGYIFLCVTWCIRSK